ncbi:hypothetical protein LINPERPRIM_LOCUS37004, partial [Linum perenne]
MRLLAQRCISMLRCGCLIYSLEQGDQWDSGRYDFLCWASFLDPLLDVSMPGAMTKPYSALPLMPSIVKCLIQHKISKENPAKERIQEASPWPRIY